MRQLGAPCGKCNRARPSTQEYQRRWKAEHAEQMREYSKKWRAENADHLREYKAVNRDKIRSVRREYNIENADAHREYARRWRKSNPHKKRTQKIAARARKASAVGSHTTEEWEAVKARQRGKCAHCGKKKELTRDHVIPLSKGGSNYIWNIQGLCKPCNSHKHAHIAPGTQMGIFDQAS